MTGLSSQPLWAQGFIFKASLLPWCTALSPMPSAWPASTASSAGKPLPAQPSRTHRQVPHRATLPPSAPRSHHFLLRCPQTMPPRPDACPVCKAIHNLSPHCGCESGQCALTDLLVPTDAFALSFRWSRHLSSPPNYPTLRICSDPCFRKNHPCLPYPRNPFLL